MKKHAPWLRELEKIDPMRTYTAADLAEVLAIEPRSVIRGLKSAGVPPDIRLDEASSRFVASWPGSILVSAWDIFRLKEGDKMTSADQMEVLLKSFPYARRSSLRDFFKWDATKLDEWASGGLATTTDKAVASFALSVWSSGIGRWDWKTPQFSIRALCEILPEEDRAVIARYVQNPFFL